MDEYDGRQFVGIDLHRQRSVIVRQSESGEQLSAVRILNDPASLQLQLEQAGIMAVFGAPLALEDHAVRALPCGIGNPGRNRSIGRRGWRP